MHESGKTFQAMRKSANSAIHLLGSLKLAVVLLLLFAAVLAAATFLEAAKGRDYAGWYVYDQPGSSPCWACLA